MHPKIKSREELAAIVMNIRKEHPDKKIVTTNGAFDILHAGHVKSLTLAKAQGDMLVVGVNSDKSVKSYKGPTRPLIGELDRALLLASLECVDYVTLFDETDCTNFVDNIGPDVHVKSKSGYKGVEAEAVAKHGGTVFLIDDIPGISTSEIVRKIKES